MDTRLLAAASNNAQWCRLIGSTHGVPGEFHRGCWINPQPMPPFYPNMVTFSPLVEANDIQMCLTRLRSHPPTNSWGVKDSFMELKLAGQGFDVLFEASWIWRDPGAEDTPPPADEIDWILIHSADLLRDWELGWTSDGDDYLGIFKPALLELLDVVIVGGRVAGRFVAGGIGLVTGDVVGVSNVFTRSGEELPCWQTVTRRIRQKFPAKPLVGYEAGEFLDLARQDGFQPIGDSRIWSHKEPRR